METRYDQILSLALPSGKTSMSDKSLAARLGVSERQTRALRMTGTVDDYMADKMAVALGTHPQELFGYDDWIGDDENMLRIDREADEADKKALKKAQAVAS